MTWLQRVVHLLLPRGFRERHGDELIALHRELHRDEQRFRRARFVVGVLRDALLTGVAARVDDARRWIRHRSSRETAATAPQSATAAASPMGAGLAGIEGLFMDVRLAARSLRQTPAFTLAAVLILALGIGANTTVFCAFKAALLTPPPFMNADRLVVLELKRVRNGNEIGEGPWWPTPAFETLRSSTGGFVDVVANYRTHRLMLTGRGLAAEIEGEITAPDYFSVLGVQTQLGRTFAASEGNPANSARVTILSHAFWQERFAGDPRILGQELTVSGKPYQVIGVAPRGFKGLTGLAQLWIPTGVVTDFIRPDNLRASHNHIWYAVGRLRRGARLDEAQARMRVIGQRIDREFSFGSALNLHYVAGAKLLHEEWQHPGAKTAVLLLTAAAILVLFLACADLSGLLIARYRQRSHDSGVRLALGATRWQLARSWLVECSLLSGLGGVAGVVLAYASAGVLRAAWPDQLLDSPRGGLRIVDLDALAVDGMVLGFAAGTVVVVAVLVGLVPALRASRIDPGGSLKLGPSGGRRPSRVLGFDAGQCMVAVQVALALTLVIGAGLLTRSVKRVLDVPRGYRAENLLTFEYSMPREWSPDARTRFGDEMMRRLGTLPGIIGLARGCAPVPGVCSATAVFGVEGQAEFAPEERLSIAMNVVDDRYFSVMEIPILEGRSLDRSDIRGSRPTAVIDETAARRFFGRTSPVGRWISIGRTRFEIVGMAARVLHDSPDHTQMPEAYVSSKWWFDARVVMVRTSVPPASLVTSIRRSVDAMSSDVVPARFATADERVARTTSDRRMILALLAVFSVVSVLLVAIGTWAIVARTVADRRREFGVRVALGALGRQLVLPVLRQCVMTTTFGLGTGLILTWTATPALESYLYGTTSRDAATFIFGGVLILAVVGLASCIPVRRALKVDPLETLRAE